MADIFQEVDEELRGDRASALWAKYQNVVYGLVALIILGTAATIGLRAKRHIDWLKKQQA